jgi:hypothetical protein
MTTPLLVKISRDGQEIGTYEAKEAVRLLLYGTLKETDFYWHEGMTEWEPLPKLRVSEARRVLAEQSHQAKQEEIRRAEQLAAEEARKAEQIARDKVKAQEEEDRAVAEATRIRLEKEKANWFKCHCCRESFPKPMGGPEGDSDGVQVLGVIILLVAILAGLSTGLGLVGAILFGLMGLAMYWGPEIRSRLPSLCPNCRSTNFSRPEKTDDQK